MAPFERIPKSTIPRSSWQGLVVLAGLLFLTFLLHVGLGSSLNISPIAVIKSILAGPNGSGTNDFVVWSLRLPRAMGCIVVGMLLAGAGSAFQAIFRNPLADPYILGTSSGAAVGGVVSIILGFEWAWGGLSTPLFAFAGGLASLGIVLAIARQRGSVESTRLLLAGVLVGALLAALMALCLYLAGKDTNQVTRWLLGSVDPMFWSRVAIMGIVLLVCGSWLISRSRLLNGLAMGEEASARLGVNVKRVRLEVLIAGALMTSAAVGATGIIPFVGLAAPHIARRTLGVDWRISLPASMMMGAIVLLVADALGARIVADGIPVGVITALLGAPVLMSVLGKTGA